MGIPVVDFSAPQSFAGNHPVLTVLFIVGMVITLVALFDLSRAIMLRMPTHAKKLRAALFAIFIAGSGAALWGLFKPQPSIFEEVTASVSKMAQELQKTNHAREQEHE